VKLSTRAICVQRQIREDLLEFEIHKWLTICTYVVRWKWANTHRRACETDEVKIDVIKIQMEHDERRESRTVKQISWEMFPGRFIVYLRLHYIFPVGLLSFYLPAAIFLSISVFDLTRIHDAFLNLVIATF